MIKKSRLYTYPEMLWLNYSYFKADMYELIHYRSSKIACYKKEIIHRDDSIFLFYRHPKISHTKSSLHILDKRIKWTWGMLLFNKETYHQTEEKNKTGYW